MDHFTPANLFGPLSPRLNLSFFLLPSSKSFSVHHLFSYQLFRKRKNVDKDKEGKLNSKICKRLASLGLSSSPLLVKSRKSRSQEFLQPGQKSSSVPLFISLEGCKPITCRCKVNFIHERLTKKGVLTRFQEEKNTNTKRSHERAARGNKELDGIVQTLRQLFTTSTQNRRKSKSSQSGSSPYDENRSSG